MKKYIVTCTILATVIVSCTKNITDINVDPTQFQTVTPEGALQGSFKKLTDFIANNNYNRWWDIANIINAGQRYNVEDGGLWQNMYVNVLEPIAQVKNNYASDTNFVNRLQIARIWEAYTYSILVGNFGPVARSQANDLTKLNGIKYDLEDSVFTYVLNTLQDAAKKININKTTDVLNFDAIFGVSPNIPTQYPAQNLTRWIKFANTLRLKIALTCSKNLPALSSTHIKDVMSNDALTITSEAESAQMTYENVNNNQNPYYVRFALNAYTTDPPVLMDVLFVYFRSYKDPRLDAYYDSVPAVGTNAANLTLSDRYVLLDTLMSRLDDSLRVVTYTIPHFAKPKSSNKLPGWTNLAGVSDPLATANIRTYSRLKGYGWVNGNNKSNGAGLIAPTAPFMILSYAESCFLKAEAAQLGMGGSKTAEQYYNEGIDANCAHWKIGNVQRDAYKAQNGVKWGTAGIGFYDYVSIIKADIPLDNLAKIYIQEWINFFPDQAFDAWTLQRRTRAVNMSPHTNPNNGVVTTPYMDIPLRGQYPFSSLQLNPVGYNDALSQIGATGNDFNPYIALKFVKNYTVPDWNAMPATYNTQYLQKWYGNYIQDLTSAGVKYTVTKTYK